MHNWLINCVAVLILCVFCAGFVIPQILLIAFRKKLFDEPDERKIHKSLVPRLGGIAFNPVILFSIFFVFGIDIALSDSQVLLTTLAEICPLLFGFCAMLILYLVGMADDLIGVKYRAKFFAQNLCAGLLMAGGIWENNFHGALNLYGLPAVF